MAVFPGCIFRACGGDRINDLSERRTHSPMRQAARAANSGTNYVPMGQILSLTEHFKLGADGHVAVLDGAGVDALIVLGDVRDL